MYTPIYFETFELVPRSMYDVWNDKALMFLDDRLLYSIDSIRGLYDRRAVINDWYWGGDRKYSGYRPAYCHVGAALSQHRFGRAVDMLVEGIDSERIRSDIIANPNKEEFRYINAIEMGVSWLHIDTRNCFRIMQFNG